jgi:hypothetical protein
MPGAPSLSTRQAKPDYSKTDAELAAAKPKEYGGEQGDIEHRFGMKGLYEALQQITPDTPPLMAAGQLITAYLTGQKVGKDVFEERNRQAEVEQSKYQLMLAGVDEKRAEIEAERQQKEIDAANENKKMAYAHSLDMLKLGQTQLQVGNDGTIVSQQYDPRTGKTTVQTFGFEDAFKRDLALKTAAALGGKEGAAREELNAIRSTGTAGALYSLAKNLEEVGAWDVVMTPEEKTLLEEAEKRGVNKFLAGGGKIDKQDMQRDIRTRIIVQMLANDPTLIERATKLIK